MSTNYLNYTDGELPEDQGTYPPQRQWEPGQYEQYIINTCKRLGITPPKSTDEH